MVGLKLKLYMREKPPALSNGLIPKGIAMGWIGGEELKDTQPINHEQFNLLAGGGGEGATWVEHKKESLEVVE